MSVKYDRKESEEIIEQAVLRVTPLLPNIITSIEDIESNVFIFFEDAPFPYTEENLRDLFQWKRIRNGKEFAKGFPGIVLTASIGRMIDPSYDPKNDFYGINPRPLFEQHIGPTLRDKYKAPMGKSDPLNVAKNAKVIDSEWAHGRRPEYAAKAAVFFIDWMRTASRADLENLVDLLIWCYLALSRLYNRELPNIKAGISHFEAYALLMALIEKAPAGGDTPQVIVGSLLQAQHNIFDTSGFLDGVGESVNASNTTTGKAGDFTEIFNQNMRIYEVTTKKIDIQRIFESADAVVNFLRNIDVQPKTVEITFLCPLDKVELEQNYKISPTNATFQFSGLRYSFVELNEWILFMLERIGAYGRSLALNDIAEYVQSPSTKLEVKSVWEKQVIYSI